MDLFSFIAVMVCAVALMLDFQACKSLATREFPDTEILFRLARITETSEFEQFRRAARDWNFSEQKAETDFNRYILQEDLPFYVRDYLRNAKESHPDLQRPKV